MSCQSPSGDKIHAGTTDPTPKPALVTDPATCPVDFKRDWAANPALFVREGFAETLYAQGDVHGSFPEFYGLLRKAGLITGPEQATTDQFEWNAGKAIFVQVGDLISKGDDSLDVLRFALALEKKAEQAGGAAVFLAGNHEVGFIASPFDPKFKSLRREIQQKGKDVCIDVNSSQSVLGDWLRKRPAAAIVNGVYFSHSGWSVGMSRDLIAQNFQAFVDKNSWDGSFMCGDSSKSIPGFFNANDWWGSQGENLKTNMEKIKVRQIIFGHDPSAFKAKGKVASYFFDASTGASLTKIDVGLWQGDSPGVLWRCSKWLSSGGCAVPQTYTNGTPGAEPVFETLPQIPGPPPKSKVSEIRPWC